MGMDKKTPDISNRDIPSAIFFVSGLAAVLMGYSVYSHLKTVQERNNAPRKPTNKNGVKMEDSIQLKSLAYLTQSHDVNIQSSSVKIILERAMSAQYLTKLIAACEDDQPIEIKSKALPALQLLTRKENNKATLLEAGALSVLVDALKCTDPKMTEVTKRYVTVAICDLIQGSDINKYCILEMGVLEPIKSILTSTEIKNNELKYWTLMILYQISLSDPLPKVLIEDGIVSLLAKMARMTYGNTNIPKFCMQSLVRIAANVDVSEAKKILKELLNYNIVELISTCLRGDDVELIYWAAGLMHEFVLKDVAADKFREIKGIHTILAGLLSAEEMYISRVILRTIKFIAIGQENFRQEMVRSGIVKKIMHCLSLDDEDVRYWAILCIHVVAGQVESHEDIISSQEFEILLELALSTKIKVSLFVSDILSLICCISSNSTFMEPHINSIVKTLNTLLIDGELDVQYNAAGAIFNVMTMTTGFASKIRDMCFETLVLLSTSATHERVQLTCAKGALMVAIKNQFLVPQINNQITDTLIESVNSISNAILPVTIIQSQIRAMNDTSNNSKSGFSIHDAMNVNSNDAELEIGADSSGSRRQQNDENEDDSQYPKEYIDVNEQGIISNASRLDRVLKVRERSSKKSNRKEDSVITSADVSYLFDTSIPTSQREKLFMQFELSEALRDQLIGALTALNVLLENDQIISNVITGETFKFPMLDIEYSSINTGSSSYSEKRSRLNDSNSNIHDVYLKHTKTNDSALPEKMRQLIHNLVHLSLFPVLTDWASSHSKEFRLDDTTESKAQHMYDNIVQSICACTKLPELNSDLFYEQHSSEDEFNSDSSSSSEGYAVISIHAQRRPSLRTNKRDRMNSSRYRNSRQSSSYSTRRNKYDTSTEDSDIDLFDRDSASTSYPPQRKKIESAAERLGETRRKGEPFDLDDMTSASYAAQQHFGFSNRALVLLNSLIRYASVRQYLVQETHFVSILMYLYENHSSLADRVMICLGSLFTSNPDITIPEPTFQLLTILLWRNIRFPNSRKNSYLFYSQLVLSYCSRYISAQIKTDAFLKKAVPTMTNNPLFVEIDLLTRSKYCLINHENYLQVRNDSWTFETVKATHCVPALFENNSDSPDSQKYAFEVVLETDGLMQVGWVAENFQFDSEGGKGVGDDNYSYGYDGNRSKKWHGRFTSMRTSYGLKWAEGDIITCAIDMCLGKIRYYKNGVDMGLAFHGVSNDCSWYPAISLSTGQQCRFQFGGSLDPLKYLPAGYKPIAVLALETPISVKLPPPHFTKTFEKEEIAILTDSEENDIMDLAKALQKMSVKSPISPLDNILIEVGNAEPNLKPVDSGLNSSESTTSLTGKKNHIKADSVEASTSKGKDQNRFIVQTQNIHRKSFPSLYFEVTVDYFNKIEENLSHEENIITFGLQGLKPGHRVYFEYNRTQQKCCLGFGEHKSESFDILVKDGDTIGIIYIDETCEFGLTLNGNVQVYVYLKENNDFKPYLPVVTGMMRSSINYGGEPFKWKVATGASSIYHIYNYFDKLLQTSSRLL